MDDESFLKQFEAALLPFAEWHHRQHIKVACLYLHRFPFETAMTRMRTKIQELNVAHQVPDLPARGYHETMTQVWMRLVYLTLCEYGAAATADDFYEQHPQLSHKSILRLFYSRDLLMSPRAKAEFVHPDLAPLPQSPKKWEATVKPCLLSTAGERRSNGGNYSL